MLSYSLVYLARTQALGYQPTEKMGIPYLAKKAARIALYTLSMSLNVVDWMITWTLTVIVTPLNYFFRISLDAPLDFLCLIVDQQNRYSMVSAVFINGYFGL